MNNFQLYRLGKYEQNKTRPIKVTFERNEDVLAAIKNKTKLGEQVYIKRDQTRSQIENLKKVIEELERRKGNGENGLRIRYINSVPKIIEIREAPKN